MLQLKCKFSHFFPPAAIPMRAKEADLSVQECCRGPAKRVLMRAVVIIVVINEGGGIHERKHLWNFLSLSFLAGSF